MKAKVCTPSGQPTNRHKKNSPLQQSINNTSKPSTLECVQGVVDGVNDNCNVKNMNWFISLVVYPEGGGIKRDK